MNQTSPIKQRILEYINYLGLSKYEFYKKTNITRGILDQGHGITEANITKFLAFFDEVNISWLIMGSGEMLNDKTGPTSIMAKKYHPRQNIKNIPRIAFSIPIVPIERLNDYLSATENENKERVPFDYNVETLFSDVDFYTRVRDLSFYPLYNCGDLIACRWVHLSDFIQWNKIYLLATGQGALLKRVLKGRNDRYFTMQSDNPDFKSFEIAKVNIKAMAIIRGRIALE